MAVSLRSPRLVPGSPLETSAERRGSFEVSCPYYWCPSCHAGQFPVDVELDIENTALSPGARRMLAMVGQDAPFDHGRE